MIQLSDEVLAQLKRELAGPTFSDSGATIGVFVYDHHTEEIHYETMEMTDRKIARENDMTLTNDLLERASRTVLAEWRGETE